MVKYLIFADLFNEVDVYFFAKFNLPYLYMKEQVNSGSYINPFKTRKK